MSCFVRHMIQRGIFFELGVPVSEEDTDEMKEKIAHIVGMDNRDCSEIWAEVRKWLEDPKLKEKFQNKLLKTN